MERREKLQLEQDAFVSGVATAAARAHELLDRTNGLHTHSLETGVRRAATLLSAGMVKRLRKLVLAANVVRHSTPHAWHLLVEDLAEELAGARLLEPNKYDIASHHGADIEDVFGCDWTMDDSDIQGSECADLNEGEIKLAHTLGEVSGVFDILSGMASEQSMVSHMGGTLIIEGDGQCEAFEGESHVNAAIAKRAEADNSCSEAMEVIKFAQDFGRDDIEVGDSVVSVVGASACKLCTGQGHVWVQLPFQVEGIGGFGTEWEGHVRVSGVGAFNGRTSWGWVTRERIRRVSTVRAALSANTAGGVGRILS